MIVDVTTLLSSAIAAAVNGVAVVLATRYAIKAVDHIESKRHNGNGNGTDK